jgi:2-dehydro-3-deoxygluconokinase
MDLVTFGEAMVRLSPSRHQRIENARGFDAYIGGTELNTAVGAAHLGIATRWLSRLSENALGRLIAHRAREEGVETLVEWTSGDRIGLYFIEHGFAPRQANVLYDRAGSAVSRIAPGSIDWAAVFRGARWFHISGITPALSDSAAAVTGEALETAKAVGLTVSYDVNYRVNLWSAERARAVQESFMKYVDLLIVSEEDARSIFSATGDTPELLARVLSKRFRVGAVAITVRDSTDGCGGVVVADDSVHSAPRHEVAVVDRVGTGDAFSAGLIAGRLESRDWDDALQCATALAALKLGTAGDFSLSTRADVERLLQASRERESR